MHLFDKTYTSALKPALLLTLLLTAFGSASAQAAEPRVAVASHAALAPALRGARLLGRLAANAPLRFALTLPLRNQAALDNLVRRQYTQGDPLYGHFLTSDEFTERFGPTEEDYAAVAAFAQSQGLTITGTHATRTLLDVAGSSAQVEAAFGIQMGRYRLADGRLATANSAAPRVPRSIASRLAGVAGLGSVSQMHPTYRSQMSRLAAMRPAAPPKGTTQIGSGPAGGLTPNDIKFAYNLATITPLYGSVLGTTGTGTTGTGTTGTGTTGTGTTGTGTTGTGTTGTGTTGTGTTGTGTTGTGTTGTGTTGTGTTGTGTTGTGTTGGAVAGRGYPSSGGRWQSRASGTGTVATTGTGTTGTATLLDGAGQTLGLFELDTYKPSDIALFVNQYSLPTILPQVATATTPATLGTVQPVSVDNFDVNTAPGVGQGEVTLDIDMMLALAPNATAIYSYEGTQAPATTTGTSTTVAGTSIAVDIFQRMADDRAADGSGKPLLQIISCSWVVAEQDEDPAIRAAENAIFQKMSAQGQSVFCATGDEGAFARYPTTKTLQVSVNNPASQPYVTAVGGTSLKYNKPTINTTTGATIDGLYVSETAWKTGTVNNPPTAAYPTGGPEGSGGGSSVIWPKPDYQVGLGASPLRRDVPDVALNADPNAGYDIYVNGAVATTGGTSASAPLWAAFAALANQQRGLNGLSTLGFFNPTLYSLGRGSSYTSLFHDITLGDNLFYSAQPGFDDATGFGSFIGDQLIAALSSNADQGTQTATLTGTVTDSIVGSPIVGVTVTATSVATGTVKATTTTDSSGTYTLTVPGDLALTITLDTSTIVSDTTSTSTVNYAGQTSQSITVPANTIGTLNFVLSPGHTFAAGLQMISAPYDFSGQGDFAALFGLATPLANPNPRLIQWQPALGIYVFYPTAPADTLRLGQGYWIKFPTATFLHRLGTPLSTAQSFTIPLQKGWNQIGDPFLGSVPLSSVTASTTSGSTGVPLTDATSPVQSNVYRYNQAANVYEAVNPSTGTLDPFLGYWIFAKQAAVLTVPPQAPPPPTDGLPGVPLG